MQDTSKTKEMIISVLRAKGPSFPSPIASEIKTSILFTSAFLSELLSEKRIKITDMKVGSSPIYHLEGQEEHLENFAKQYLKSKEKDAFILLQENKFLKDTEQEPAIRVALRSIKDFAIPEEKNDELYWKYYLEKEITPEKHPEKIIDSPKEEIEKKESIEEQKEKIKLEKSPEKIFEETPKTKKTTRKKVAKKQDDKFFNIVKEYLSENKIEIIDIVSIGKSDLTFRVKKDDEEQLLIAYKKRVGEQEIIAANKKASDHGLKYLILSTSDPLKKTINLFEALKNMSDIKKI